MAESSLHPLTAPRRFAWFETSPALPTVAAVAAVVVVVGITLAPGRTWPGLLITAVYAVGLALGGMLFLAFHYLTAAGWSVCLKRVAEAIASTLPLGAALMLTTLGGIHVLYEWSRGEAVAHDAILQAKAAWLDVPFFIGRAVLYLALWLLFCRTLIGVSRRQDATGGLAANRRSTALSALFIVVYIVTFSAASVDWLMSLEPHWFSTIFAAYNFAGTFVSGLAAIMIVGIALRRTGPLEGIVNQNHLHDLAKLILGFCTFWAYLWFCQYMLIWYANLPEEATYYIDRHAGAWAVLSGASLAVNWVIPFLVLLSRTSKRDESALLRVACLLLVGRWLDLYVMVQPVFTPEGPILGAWELAPMVLAGAAFVILLRRGLRTADVVPQGDPYLEESRYHRV